MNPVSYNPSEFRTKADFDMVRSLMARSGWAMPENLKKRVIDKIGDIVQDTHGATIMDQLAACKLAVEVDRQALQFVKAVMPTRVEHRLVKDYTDEELNVLVDEATTERAATRLLPQ